LTPEVADPSLPVFDSIDWSSLPIDVSVEGAKRIPLLLPGVRAGQTVFITVDLTVVGSAPFGLTASVGRPLIAAAQPEVAAGPELVWAFPQISATPTGDTLACAKGVTKYLSDVLSLPLPLGTGCAVAVADHLVDMVTAPLELDMETVPWSILTLFTNASATTLGLQDCGVQEIVLEKVGHIADALNLGVQLGDIARDCDGVFLKQAQVLLQVSTVTSFDPNDKVGSVGSGLPLFYISGEQPLRYSVMFENVGGAAAPAQEVIVVDQLDPTTVDLSTFTFGPVAFGDTRIDLPLGANAETTVDLRPENNLLVRVKGDLDEASGRVEWRFTSLDPATGLPPGDPLAGFLPPNINPPEGDGSVVFTVAPRADLTTGTQITKHASIVFDTNEPILTPVWLNTINQPRCGTVPDTGCRHTAAGASTLKIRDQLDDSRDTFAWNWKKGDATSVLNFRDPLRGFDDYRVCLYDSSARPQPLMESEVLRGENCAGQRCWRQSGTTGFKFKSKLGANDGMSSLTLKAGVAGKASLKAKGKGPNLGLPSVPLIGPVTVQFLVNDGRSRECWETVYSAPSKNGAGKFDAKGP
jgi:hypothetical protein